MEHEAKYSLKYVINTWEFVITLKPQLCNQEMLCDVLVMFT